MGAVQAVFRSWDNPRANVYRRDNDIPYSWGTAVNAQSMAFGNMGDDCGTGVKGLHVILLQAKRSSWANSLQTHRAKTLLPAFVHLCLSLRWLKVSAAFEKFQNVCKTLEDHYRDMQDMEFTVEHGELFMFRQETEREQLRLL